MTQDQPRPIRQDAFARARGRRWRASVAATVLLGSLLAGGCVSPPLPPATTTAAVVEAINANNTLLPHFKARIRTMEATLVGQDGWPRRFDMFGYLIYDQPMHVNLNATVGVEPVMGLGSNDRLYWLWIRPGVGRCYVGDYAHWDPTRPGQIPVHPLQLMQLLGIDAIAAGDQAPLPVLRIDPQERAYVLGFVGRVDGQPTLLREWVIGDARTMRPRAVRVYDRFGLVTLESQLGDWKPVSGSAGQFPHDVRVRWINYKPVEGGLRRTAGSSLHLVFSDVQVDEKFSADSPIYQFRCPGDLEVVPLDEQPTTGPARLMGD